MRVPEYFNNDELVCHCGCGLLPPQRSVERLYIVRGIISEPMPISSAARCKRQNKISGGKNSSAHIIPELRTAPYNTMDGCGFDIIANRAFQMKIFAAALTAGFRGFGFAKDYIHIDDMARPEIIYWTY